MLVSGCQLFDTHYYIFMACLLDQSPDSEPIWTNVAKDICLIKQMICKIRNISQIFQHFCSIPSFLTGSCWQPRDRNTVWVHHFHQHTHHMTCCFPTTWRWELPRSSAAGSERFRRSCRHDQRLPGISVLIHHWAEIWIIHRNVCGFI